MYLKPILKLEEAQEDERITVPNCIDKRLTGENALTEEARVIGSMQEDEAVVLILVSTD